MREDIKGKAARATDTRAEQLADIVKLFYAGQMTQGEVAIVCGLSKSGAWRNMVDLVENNVIYLVNEDRGPCEPKQYALTCNPALVEKFLADLKCPIADRRRYSKHRAPPAPGTTVHLLADDQPQPVRRFKMPSPDPLLALFYSMPVLA